MFAWGGKDTGKKGRSTACLAADPAYSGHRWIANKEIRFRGRQWFCRGREDLLKAKIPKEVQFYVEQFRHWSFLFERIQRDHNRIYTPLISSWLAPWTWKHSSFEHVCWSFTDRLYGALGRPRLMPKMSWGTQCVRRWKRTDIVMTSRRFASWSVKDCGDWKNLMNY